VSVAAKIVIAVAALMGGFVGMWWGAGGPVSAKPHPDPVPTTVWYPPEPGNLHVN